MALTPRLAAAALAALALAGPAHAHGGPRVELWLGMPPVAAPPPWTYQPPPPVYYGPPPGYYFAPPPPAWVPYPPPRRPLFCENLPWPHPPGAQVCR